MRGNRTIRDAALAVTLLTAVPLPVRWPHADAEKRADTHGRPDAASWFPAVGLVIGLLLSASLVMTHRVFYGLSPVAAALVVIALATVTRGMHWDAAADTADGWFVAPERRLEVMADSHVGAFGALAIALLALLQWAAVAESAGTVTTAALTVLAPTFGRLAATFSAWLGKPARPGGLGASIVRRPSLAGATAAAAAVVLSGVAASSLGAPLLALGVVMAASLVLALAVPHLIALRFGGVTGDTMGASVLVTETAVLVLSLAVVGVLRLLGVAA